MSGKSLFKKKRIYTFFSKRNKDRGIYVDGAIINIPWYSW